MEAFAAEEHVGRRALWELRRGELLRTLQDIVEAETRPGARPIEFERRFGYPGSWEALRIPDPAGAEIAFVRGAIDRIDRDDRGDLLGRRCRARVRERGAACLSSGPCSSCRVARWCRRGPAPARRTAW